MIDEQFVEVSLGKYILFLVKVLADEEEGGVSLGDTGDVGLELCGLAYLLEFDLRGTSYLVSLKKLLLMHLRHGYRMPVLPKNVRHPYLLIVALSLQGLPDTRGHLDVLVGVGSIY
jgi:hypothetical protein